jgi:hypothetical protein
MMDAQPGGRSALRRLALPLALLVIGLPAGILIVTAVGDPPPDKSPFIPIGQARAQARTAEPRWEPVRTVTGTGAADAAFTIAAGAAQWKTTMNCEAGRMRVVDTAAPAGGEELAATTCPHAGVATRTDPGAHRLHVSAGGPWRIVVEQQVDTALMRAPLAGMTADTLVARGRMRSIQRRAEGDIALYRLPGGRLALRFDRFYTTGSPGLEVWLSQARNPDSTLDARDAPHVNAGRLRSTLGTYNQLLPPEATVDDIRSVVIWCPTVTIAFGAANLRSS